MASNKIRIVLCGYGPLAMALLHALHQQSTVQVVAVVDWHDCTEASNTLSASLVAFLQGMARWWQGLQTLLAHLVKQPLPPTELSQLAHQLAIPSIQGVTGLGQGSHPAYPHLQTLAPDVILCCTWGEKLSARLLETESVFLNVHPSLLPRHRGALPISMGLWQGDTQFGLSLHRMTPDWDAGEILWQTALHVAPNTGSREVQQRLAQQLPQLVQTVFHSHQQFYQVLHQATPQEEALASFHQSSDVPCILPFDSTPVAVLERGIRAKEAWGGLLVTGILEAPLCVVACHTLPTASTPLHRQRGLWFGKQRYHAHYTGWGKLHHLWVYHAQDDCWVKLTLA